MERTSDVRRVVTWVAGAAGLVAAGLIAFALSFYAAMKFEMRSSGVPVPDVTGLTTEEAARHVRDAGLTFEIVQQKHDPVVSSGRVLQQEPPAGAAVRRGRKIRFVVSLGGRVIQVPDLIGQGARAAEIEIQRAGLRNAGEARVHRARAVGEVVAQVPAPLTPAVPGAGVHRLVSEGPDPVRWVMPDLTGRARSAAERWIDRWDFRRGAVRFRPDDGHAPGTVVGQLPLAGHPVIGCAVVELTVAQ